MKKNKKVVAIITIIVVIGTLLGMSVVNKNKIAKVETNETKKLNLQSNANMTVQKDFKGNDVPVPNGYVGSSVVGENEIDTGYVIYEGTEPVTNSNVAEAQKQRNQYVWVPVQDVNKLYGTDSSGKKWGKIYGWTMDEGSSIDPITGTYASVWSERNGVMNFSSMNHQREPDITSYWDQEHLLKKYMGNDIQSGAEFLMELEKEFNEMIESVQKYGGYYVGRYETGDLTKDNVVVKKGNTDINTENSENWDTIYVKSKKLSGENQSVKTSIIWDSLFDRTLMWLIESGNKTKEQVISDSSDWGNYKNVELEYTNSDGEKVTKPSNVARRIPTGSSEKTKANNIYDLAGNVLDWTMSAYESSSKVARGGIYDTSSKDAASIMNTGSLVGGYCFGFRAMLYIK